MQREVRRLYEQYRAYGTFNSSVYMMKNADEFFAEASQARSCLALSLYSAAAACLTV